MLWEFWNWRRESFHKQGIQQSFLEHCPLTEPLRQAMWLFLRLGFIKKEKISVRGISGQRVWGMLLGSIMNLKNVINFTLPYLKAAGFLNLA